MKGNNKKVIWLTGASSGIGEALAFKLSLKDISLFYRPKKNSSILSLKRNAYNWR